MIAKTFGQMFTVPRGHLGLLTNQNVQPKTTYMAYLDIIMKRILLALALCLIHCCPSTTAQTSKRVEETELVLIITVKASSRNRFHWDLLSNKKILPVITIHQIRIKLNINKSCSCTVLCFNDSVTKLLRLQVKIKMMRAVVANSGTFTVLFVSQFSALVDSHN